MLKKITDFIAKHLRKGVVLIVGSITVLIGVIMIITPGPALVLIPSGLLILSSEFKWAKKLLARLRQEGGEASSKVWAYFNKNKPSSPPSTQNPEDKQD